MGTNISQYKSRLKLLITNGENLLYAMNYECFSEKFKNHLISSHSISESEKIISDLPIFKSSYQTWYTESIAIIKLLLPDRLEDFKQFYEIPKNRKDIGFETYKIYDYLQGVSISVFTTSSKIGPSTAIPLFRQQLEILKAAELRFENSLLDIKQIIQADFFDSEIETATHMAQLGFLRASGAICGVVLEKHLLQVCINHEIKSPKKDPSIADLNDSLKSAAVIEVADWRFIQFLADIRNICDHNKSIEPTKDQVNDLIAGVDKVLKTIF
ncbi:MAG: hypothetical protein VB013_04755 [Anaerolineaceae bacterium]|nr:hypothetical protein [Anaerolineaceae bacterium]